MTYKYTKLRISQFIFIIMLLFIAVEAGWCEEYTKHDFGYICVTTQKVFFDCNYLGDCIVVVLPVRECTVYKRKNTAEATVPRERRMPEVTIGR